MLDEQPENVEEWLTSVIKNKNSDHANRKRQFPYRDAVELSRRG